MAYQGSPSLNSNQPFNSNNPFRYAAPPPYQPNSGSEFNVAQDMEAPSFSKQAVGARSKTSSEDGSEPGQSDEDILAQATEFTRRTQPPVYKPSALFKPVAVPQTIAGTGQAFARCWSPALTPYNITASDFLEFLDNLNVVSTASPPLQVLDLVGGVLGMVPHHIFQLAGGGVQALAKLGTVVVSKSRTDMYMKAVNKDFFGPRGLKATIVSRDAMAMSLRLPDSVGRLAPITDENMTRNVVERRLEGMQPYIAELNFDVPPPVQQTTVLAKMSAAQVKRQTAKAEKKVLKQRRKQLERVKKTNDKLYEDQSKEQRKFEREMIELDKDDRKAEKDADSRKGGRSVEKAERKLREELAKTEEKRRKAEREFGQDRRDAKITKKDRESKQAMKALWILVENV